MAPMLFRQRIESRSCTYTYLLADEATGEALLIDPVLETAPRDAALVRELGLALRYTLETHCHADHVTGADALRRELGSEPAAPAASGIRHARLLADGEVLRMGGVALEVLYTPGHTEGDACYLAADRVFTGDTLLIGACGRTDFQHGDAARLYDSVHRRLFTLPEATRMFPAHDYHGRTESTIGEQKRHNPRLAGRRREAFVEIMAKLGLPYPKQIERAVPANMEGGRGAEPVADVPAAPAERFFAIPELFLAVLEPDGRALEGLPAAPALTLPPHGWGTALERFPRSRTVGLVSRRGAECGALARALAERGHDVVVLEGGLAGMGR